MGANAMKKMNEMDIDYKDPCGKFTLIVKCDDITDNWADKIV